MSNILYFIETLISGTLPFVLLTLCGGYFTVKSRFFQFRNFFKSFSSVFSGNARKSGRGGLNSFQSVCTSLSATLGTGNIAGVAGAVSIGGAGAVFWMWVTALVGMCVKGAEIALAVVYREKRGKEFVGGPMYYIKNALPKKFLPLGFIFAFVGIFSVICSGNITQTNAVVLSIGTDFRTRLAVGIIFTLITAAVILGGVGRIGVFTEKTVPVMSVLYIVLCLGILINNREFVPTAFKMIFEGAFNPKAVTGGAVGAVSTAVFSGASRGIFSNEAGLGTSAIAHSAAYDADSSVQGLYGIFEVFVDTLLLCTLTALTILCSGVNIDYGTVASSELVNSALSTLYGNISGVLLAVMLALFGLSSIIGWALYGIVCSEYIFGSVGRKVFVAIYPLGCVIGALSGAELAWRLSAFCGGIMLSVNVISLLLLKDEAIGELNKGLKEVKNVGNKNKKLTGIFTKGRSRADIR